MKNETTMYIKYTHEYHSFQQHYQIQYQMNSHMICNTQRSEYTQSKRIIGEYS